MNCITQLSCMRHHLKISVSRNYPELFGWNKIAPYLQMYILATINLKTIPSL